MDKYSQRNKGELEKKGLRLFKGDTDIIDEFYPRAGHTIIIRTLVHDFCKKLLEGVNQKEILSDIGEPVEGSGQE